MMGRVPVSKCSDQELICLVREGKDRAFDCLFVRYRALLFRIAGRYVKDAMQAEDLVQEIGIRLFTAIRAGRYSEEGRFEVWLKRVAHNICLDQVRKPGLRYQHVAGFTEYSLQAVAPSPEDQFIQKQVQQQVRTLVSQLPDELRQVVHYRHYEEITFREISERMGTSINTALGRMRYGLRHLRTGLGKSM